MTPKRKFTSRGYIHIFQITADRSICFYTAADCMVWFTLFCVLAEKYGVHVLAVCIMLNHFHIEAHFPSLEVMAAMMQELDARFTRQYNRQYGLSGMLFKGRYGSAPKSKEQKEDKQKTTRRTTTSSGVTIIDDREVEEKKKIFDHDDGEYVEFEEV